jgi:hypothetical protein
VHDDGSTMPGSLLVIDFLARCGPRGWPDEPFTQGLYGSTSVSLREPLGPKGWLSTSA